ncbi:MAG TPA: hypothetical protein VMY88_09190 [Acidimicrobiales bacterium]|nr:hypothetical protein [Acidimicrobiales bacterium]
MKRLVVLALVAAIGIGGCGYTNSRNEARGRGDSPVGEVDDSPKAIIQFPDRFGNVAHACDGHGHRVFVTTSDPNKQLQIVADPSCGKAEDSEPQ